MLVAVVLAARHKRLDSVTHVVFLAVAASVNIGIWFIEQLVKIDFEMLSISYIISELFLLGLFLMIQENNKRLLSMQQQATVATKAAPTPSYSQEELARFSENVATLTVAERLVFDLYVQRRSSKDILEQLNIKENTLKYHNRNIYSKLVVSSRKQMLALADAMNKNTP